MKASLTRYKGDNVTEILWDKMQSKLGCCGVLSIDDWQNITWTEEPACSAPGSCKITDIVESGNATAIDTTNSTSVAEECLANLSTPHHSEVLCNLNVFDDKYSLFHVPGLPAKAEGGHAQVHQYHRGHHGVRVGHSGNYYKDTKYRNTHHSYFSDHQCSFLLCSLCCLGLCRVYLQVDLGSAYSLGNFTKYDFLSLWNLFLFTLFILICK